MKPKLLHLLIMLLALSLTFGLMLACDTGGDDDDDDEGDDDTAGDDDQGDDDSGDDDDDDDEGCLEITDPFPPQEQIYSFMDQFNSMADYVTIYQGKLVAMGQTVSMSMKADSLEIEMPEDISIGEHDLRWEADPSENDIMAFFIFELDMQYNYAKAFYAYRGCLTVEQTGPIGSNFRATITDLYMTEAEIDMGTGQVSVMMPGEGMQAFILYTEIECEIVEFSASPGMDDICMKMD